MKNLILFSAIMAFLMIGCHKEKQTTYQVVNNQTKFESIMDYLDGTIYEVVVYCYIGDDVARQDNLDHIPYGGGKSEVIDVPNNFDKVKLSFRLLPRESEYFSLPANRRNYLVSYTYLEEGKNNIVEITDNSMISGMPKSDQKFPLKTILQADF